MEENLLTCPYNISHQILPHRFATHLTKCARQYPEIKLEICPFNSNHRKTPEEMPTHKQTCPDRVTFEKEMNPIDVGAAEQEPISMPKYDYHQDDDDDWEDDVGTKGSYDAANTRQAGIKK